MTRTHDFSFRHLGVTGADADAMAQTVGYPTVEALVDAAVPRSIRRHSEMDLPEAASENLALEELRGIMSHNQLNRSFIGQGYYGTLTPPVILRNVLENPGWYTAYTPYQAEIAQGRMEALMNFQTMVCELTGLPVANASLLDEATAAAEAVHLAAAGATSPAKAVFVDRQVFPQTIDVIRTRMEPLGIEVQVGNWQEAAFQPQDGVAAVVVQYPDAQGAIHDYAAFASTAKDRGAKVIVAADLLALALLRPPGEFGADICVGSAQRFGVPMGYGGPHAAFMAVKDELKRRLPGRIVGLSIDAQGKPAYRLSLQTREQHIRREKATSNICTAQVLLAVMAGMYAVWHGPDGLREIAQSVHSLTATLAEALRRGGVDVVADAAGTESPAAHFFDTIVLRTKGPAGELLAKAAARGMNFRAIDDAHVGISLDETASLRDVQAILEVCGIAAAVAEAASGASRLPAGLLRDAGAFMRQEVFHSYHVEHEMLRYLHRLESRDLTLNESMISLGSCTMKLNATSEMLPVTWREVGGLHPFCPAGQAAGYAQMLGQLEQWLCQITGFAACSLQPNAGSQGEYAGLLAIRHFLHSRGQTQRDICLIPASAHGTNPASAVMAGMKVVPVACDSIGNIDTADLRAKAEQHRENLAALMVTYPSTHGVFEESIKDICAVIHDCGGQVYMDGANMNAQVGLTSPGDIGADVCHLNLHKTFCIPHGGGGPGVGPICVAAHLAPFLPGHAARPGLGAAGPVCAAPYGSASILVISWMYIRMMGAAGLTNASRIAILNANYIASRLHSSFPVLYRGAGGMVAHECIIDLRGVKDSSGISVEDVAKRLMDYGYHSPTMSWPVPGTLMIEPTESESRAELDRFCDALIGIRQEIRQIESGAWPRDNNPLKHAPHTAESLLSAEWPRPYSRETAAYPDARLRQHKYWPPVGRVDNVYGDKHLVCTCDPVSAYAEK